ncbi:MAG TPA: hypothetical protein VI278_03375 [Nitrososphaeraceae archaeon]
MSYNGSSSCQVQFFVFLFAFILSSSNNDTKGKNWELRAYKTKAMEIVKEIFAIFTLLRIEALLTTRVSSS